MILRMKNNIPNKEDLITKINKTDMSNETRNTAGGGVGFCGLLTIAFIVLKLCKVINWSWVWVLSPLWIGWGVVLVVFLIVVIVAAVASNNRY